MMAWLLDLCFRKKCICKADFVLCEADRYVKRTVAEFLHFLLNKIALVDICTVQEKNYGDSEIKTDKQLSPFLCFKNVSWGKIK